jgi:hypothetical protein
MAPDGRENSGLFLKYFHLLSPFCFSGVTRNAAYLCGSAVFTGIYYASRGHHTAYELSLKKMRVGY